MAVQEEGKQAPAKARLGSEWKSHETQDSKEEFRLIQQTRTKLPRLAGEE